MSFDVFLTSEKWYVQSESQSLNEKFVETKSLHESFFSVEERTKVRKLNSDSTIAYISINVRRKIVDNMQNNSGKREKK